ncbi:MAG: hypothetical protein LBT46_08245 [Planctomycetaceae bacterium]|jgi:hypothetical protein|nr:hypothetical protein [Planctomycetaceae bacterium]
MAGVIKEADAKNEFIEPLSKTSAWVSQGYPAMTAVAAATQDKVQQTKLAQAVEAEASQLLKEAVLSDFHARYKALQQQKAAAAR